MTETRTYEDRRAYMLPYLREYRRRRLQEDPEYATKVRENRKRIRQERPELHRAHEAVRRALKSGRLVKPDNCGRCGAGGPIEASHDDYTKRLEVEWLCIPCHRKKDKP